MDEPPGIGEWSQEVQCEFCDFYGKVECWGNKFIQFECPECHAENSQSEDYYYDPPEPEYEPEDQDF